MTAALTILSRADVVSPIVSIATEAGVTERWIEVGGRRIRAGTTTDAGKIWRSKTNPDGVDSTRYRWWATAAPGRRAPGPILVPNPTNPDGPPVPLRDGATGGKLYDLDEVQAAQDQRPGTTGMYRDRLSADTLRHTGLRARLLLAAGRGQLRVTESGRTEVDGEVVAPRVAQSRDELEFLGLLARPPISGPVQLLTEGREVLRRWGIDPTE